MIGDDGDDGSAAKVANFGAMAAFVLVLLIFNIVFWVVALKEQGTDAEQILQEKKTPIR